jgi:hypothetical protein
MSKSNTRRPPTQEELKDIDLQIEEFNQEMQRSLPPGLNSPLSRPEKAIIKTYILFTLGGHPSPSYPEEPSQTE